jgi:glycosyltransferase involved in cell wall biosynthesis
MENEVENFIKINLLDIKLIYIKDSASIKSLTTLNILIGYIKKIYHSYKYTLPDNYDLVYSVTGLITEVLPAYRYKIVNKRVKWIVLIDNLVPSPFSMKRGKNFIVKLLSYVAFRTSVVMLGKCDLVLTVNPIVKDYLKSIRLNYEKKTLITSNGIFWENISASEPNTSYDGVFVGRLDEGKGVFELLEIVRKLKILMGDKFLLAILGTGVEEIKARLKVKIKELNLENNICFLGYLNDRKKYAAMKSSKCFIFPSRDESFPNVILESLACGLPTIVSDLPAYTTIFPEELVIRSHFQDIDDFSCKVFEQIRSDNIMKRKKRMEYCSGLDWTEVIRAEKFNALKHLGVVSE